MVRLKTANMTYDTFEIKNRGEIWINDRALLEIIREIELPYVQTEIDERVARGEDPNNIHCVAGNYVYPHESMLYLPSRNLLNEPAATSQKSFGLKFNRSNKAKSLALECACGIEKCWFLEMRVELRADVVRWYDFSQYHRSWDYNLEFQFERGAYENQLVQNHE